MVRHKGAGVKNYRGSMHIYQKNRKKESDDNEYEEGDGIRDTIEFDNRIRKDLQKFDGFSLFRLRGHIEDTIRHRGIESTILFLERCKREGMSIDDAIKKIKELW